MPTYATWAPCVTSPRSYQAANMQCMEEDGTALLLLPSNTEHEKLK